MISGSDILSGVIKKKKMRVCIEFHKWCAERFESSVARESFMEEVVVRGLNLRFGL